MKNKPVFFSVFLILFILTNTVVADEFTLKNVPQKFIGTYIPVQYDNVLRATRSHPKALKASHNAYHDILMLHNNICYSDKGFHDGYAICSEQFNNFRFIENDAGQFIIDDKGYSYKKLSDNPYGSDVFRAYVLSIIFEDAVSFKTVSINGSTVTINNQKFEPILDVTFFERKDVSLWLKGTQKFYALMIDEASAKIVESKKENIIVGVSERVMIDFPLFFWHDKNYPNIVFRYLPKQTLRYIRNLIFAKHGYIFKSADLQSFYENFSWYKRNPVFSQNDFSNEEKDLLERIISYEKYNEKHQ